MLLIKPLIAFSDYMDKRCHDILDMGKKGIDAGYMKLTQHSNYRNNWKCTTTIQAKKNERVMIVFKEVDIEMGIFTCSGDKLRLFDGDSTSTRQLGGNVYVYKVLL